MSHIVVIKTEVRDSGAVYSACQRLRLPPPVQGTHRLFTSTVTGLAVQLPDWRYPAVCDLATGQVQYDNFREHWGETRHLDSFLQAYAVERAKAEARRRGHQTTEQRLPDGSIKITVQVNGGVA